VPQSDANEDDLQSHLETSLHSESSGKFGSITD
jgi:hypothetical protein